MCSAIGIPTVKLGALENHGDLGLDLPVRKILRRIAKLRLTGLAPGPSRGSSGPVLKIPSLNALIRLLSKRSTLARADDPQSPSSYRYRSCFSF